MADARCWQAWSLPDPLENTSPNIALSELMKTKPATAVKLWLAAKPRLTGFIDAVKESEPQLGVALPPPIAIPEAPDRRRWPTR